MRRSGCYKISNRLQFLLNSLRMRMRSSRLPVHQVTTDAVSKSRHMCRCGVSSTPLFSCSPESSSYVAEAPSVLLEGGLETSYVRVVEQVSCQYPPIMIVLNRSRSRRYEELCDSFDRGISSSGVKACFVSFKTYLNCAPDHRVLHQRLH